MVRPLFLVAHTSGEVGSSSRAHAVGPDRPARSSWLKPSFTLYVHTHTGVWGKPCSACSLLAFLPYTLVENIYAYRPNGGPRRSIYLWLSRSPGNERAPAITAPTRICERASTLLSPHCVYSAFPCALRVHTCIHIDANKEGERKRMKSFACVFLVRVSQLSLISSRSRARL